MSDVLDSYEIENKQGDIEYAGFWIRVAAGVIDTLILLPFNALVIYNYLSLKSLPLAFGFLLLTAIYKPLMEFKYGATMGKMAVKIKVVNINYRPISLKQSIIRFTPYLVSYIVNAFSVVALFSLPNFIEITTYGQYSITYGTLSLPELYASILLFGICLMMVLDKRKRAGHDILAKTYCIYSK